MRVFFSFVASPVGRWVTFLAWIAVLAVVLVALPSIRKKRQETFVEED